MWDVVENCGGCYPVFRGINAINIDAKGRLAVPARYRASLSERAHGQLIVTIDTDEHCLLLYPLPFWEEIEQKVQALPALNPAVRRIQRLLIGHATEVELDANGRILLPVLLREYAQLEKEVMLVGQGNKFEIWSKSVWTTSCEGWLDSDGGNELPPELMTISL
jgi:MraZ protein